MKRFWTPTRGEVDLSLILSWIQRLAEKGEVLWNPESLLEGPVGTQSEITFRAPTKVLRMMVERVA
jgi:hypothetical protein